MKIDASGCEGKCATIIQALGVMIHSCSAQSWPISCEMLHNRTAFWGDSILTPGKYMPVFKTSLLDVSTEPGYVGAETMALVIGITEFRNCTGAYVLTTCVLESAIMEYDVSLDGGTVDFVRSLGDAKMGAIVSRPKPRTRRISELTPAIAGQQYRRE